MTHPVISDSDYLPLPGSPEPQHCFQCEEVQLIFEDCLCVGCALAFLANKLSLLIHDDFGGVAP